ncbi:MAG TPA: glycosyltransferase family 2 protein [Patescibacteria group bacterium]|nr:glycosyltransferase family 2 protein [Patescibacteria group bacterium]
MSNPSAHGTLRRWEIVPGLFIWGTFALAVALSFFAPSAAVVLIIVFDLYWLFRVTYFVVFLAASWREYRKTIRIDWASRVRKEKGWEQIIHLVFLPTYKEDVSVIRAAFQSLCDSAYPKDRLIIVLAGEERDHERFLAAAAVMEKEFGKTFRRLIITEHPKDLPGEIPGKGSNLHFSGRTVKEILEREEPDLRPEDVVVSAFDVDIAVHPHYFSYLTYLYLTVPDPLHASYQPVALFSNNIWTATAPVRVAAFGTTFWLMTELGRPDRLWTFSSHSMPWKMLLDVGFWQKDVVSEDSRIFLQGFLHYHGHYRVVPLFLPVSMDTVVGGTYWESLTALYRQQRRWAWGVEHFPVMVEAFRKDSIIPWRKKIRYLWNHTEGMYTWATAPILIFFLGRLPFYVARNNGEALIQIAPFTLEWIMRLAMLGVFATAFLSLALLPPRPKTVRPLASFIMLLQWLLVPITFTVFGAFPAIDAQTRLMLGKYLGFNVTKKVRPTH